MNEVIMKLAAAAVVAISLFAWGYKNGSNSVKAEWNKEKLERIKAAQQERAQKEGELAGVGLAFTEKAAKVHVTERQILVKVPEYVSSDDCPLSPGFRVLYDAAVTGEEITDTARANATAVPVTDAAYTTIQNFAACRYDQERLKALQETVRVLNR